MGCNKLEDIGKSLDRHDFEHVLYCQLNWCGSWALPELAGWQSPYLCFAANRLMDRQTRALYVETLRRHGRDLVVAYYDGNGNAGFQEWYRYGDGESESKPRIYREGRPETSAFLLKMDFTIGSMYSLGAVKRMVEEAIP